MKPLSSLQSLLTPTKAIIPTIEQGGGVYMIPCQDGQHVYIGETKRTLKTRIQEHIHDATDMINRKQRCMNEIDIMTRTRSTAINKTVLTDQAMQHLQTRARTSLVSHLVECDMNYDFSAVKLLHREPNWRRRVLLEALYITKFDGKAVNHKRETRSLSPAMIVFLQKLLQRERVNNKN